MLVTVNTKYFLPPAAKAAGGFALLPEIWYNINNTWCNGGCLMINKEIDGGKAFDWGRTSKDYAKFRDIYPPEFYNRITGLGLCVIGQDVLDLGTGTGVLPRNLYPYGAKFTGADISENQIEEAKILSRESGMDISYVVAGAEDVGFPDNSFDVITACQCFFYFDKDVVLPKIHAMLKDGGHFCVLYMSWLPYEDEIARMSEELVFKYNPTWTGIGFKRLRDDMDVPDLEWAKPLFDVEHSIAYDIKVPFTRESWHGRIKACRGIGASSLPDDVIKAFEREHIQMLSDMPESFDILHYATILNLRKR